jgi:hypothetical protein
MSLKLSAFTGPDHSWEHAWPETLAADDPYCGDEVLDRPGNFENYHTYAVGERMDEAEHALCDQRFCQALRAVLNGEDGHAELAWTARKLEVDLPLTHDRRPPRSRPRPSLEQRQCLIAMLRAPAMLWWTDPLEAALPISDRWMPQGPVRGIPDVPAFVGRIYLTPEGWHSCCVLPLPMRPDLAPIRARLRIELMRQRRFERRMSWEDLLRDRGEVLYRSLCEQFWLQDETRTAVAACWSDFS